MQPVPVDVLLNGLRKESESLGDGAARLRVMAAELQGAVRVWG